MKLELGDEVDCEYFGITYSLSMTELVYFFTLDLSIVHGLHETRVILERFPYDS